MAHYFMSGNYREQEVYMNMEKLKNNIETIENVKKLMILGEKVFKKSDEAVCAITYLIERAYLLGKQNKVKITTD